MWVCLAKSDSPSKDSQRPLRFECRGELRNGCIRTLKKCQGGLGWAHRKSGIGANENAIENIKCKLQWKPFLWKIRNIHKYYYVGSGKHKRLSAFQAHHQCSPQRGISDSHQKVLPVENQRGAEGGQGLARRSSESAVGRGACHPSSLNRHSCLWNMHDSVSPPGHAALLRASNGIVYKKPFVSCTTPLRQSMNFLPALLF